MTLALSLVGHVERCPQNDRPDALGFTLNLSAGITGTASSDTEFHGFLERCVRPWLWGLGRPIGGAATLREATLEVAVLWQGKATRQEVRATSPHMSSMASDA